MLHYNYERKTTMYKNIDQKHLLELCKREPEAQLIIETMIENHKRIISTINHEICNPLTFLYNNMFFLEGEHPHMSEDKYWCSIKEEILFIKNLCEQLTTYNNSDSLRMDETDVCELLRLTVLSFAITASDSGIEFTSSIPELPKAILDKNKIKQVILNILKNALEACKSGDTIRLTTDFKNHEIIITIHNSGDLIPENILPHIFTPFKTYKRGGTGLGLAVCQEIILAHEGSLTATSNEEMGTEFVITLPLE